MLLYGRGDIHLILILKRFSGVLDFAGLNSSGLRNKAELAQEVEMKSDVIVESPG